MPHPLLTSIFTPLLATLCLLPATARTTEKLSPNDLLQIREELGVNPFTAPSIGQIFNELHDLKPIPWEKVWRLPPDATPKSRARLALSIGAAISDGFLIVTAEKSSSFEPVGRSLLKLSKGLGVGEPVTRHSQSILEKVARKKWDAVRTELAQTQTDVEASLLSLKDEEVAHLVALGGWLRGLEIATAIIVDSFSPERAQRIVQPDLIDYFLSRTQTLNPRFKSTPLGSLLEKNLQEISRISALSKSSKLTISDLIQIHDLSHAINIQVTQPEQ